MDAQGLKLTKENYTKGFLIDDEMLAGITALDQQSASSTSFLLFVVRLQSGESVFQQRFATFEEALVRLELMPRQWRFEFISQCGGGACKGGSCGVHKNCQKKFHDPSSHSPAEC